MFNSPTDRSAPGSSPPPWYLTSLSLASQPLELALLVEFGERGQEPKPSPWVLI